MLNLNSLLDQFPLGEVNPFYFIIFVNKAVSINLLSQLFEGLSKT